MFHLGIDRSTQNNIFKVLSGLLHLGNIQFSNPLDESQPCELEDKTKGEATSMPYSTEYLLLGLGKKIQNPTFKLVSSQKCHFVISPLDLP
nr:unconventional myosin-XIX-like [Anas platyrhynchos]